MEHHWNNDGSNGIIRQSFHLEDNNPLNFMYCYNYDNVQHQGCSEQVEARQGMVLEAGHRNMEANSNNLHEAGLMDCKSNNSFGNVHNHNHHHDMKKKRLNDEQLDALERSFREEIKLDPERKMRMARELGMQPRQIAVWFQNMRARWKNKQLEQMYDALKLDFNIVSREKLRLQEEVVKLRGILRDRPVASPEEETLLGLNKKKQHGIGSTAVQMGAGDSTTHFTGVNLGQEYANSQQLLSPNYWATHHQLPHYP